VRSCDGRYFPISGSDRQSRAASCNSFCPASDPRSFTQHHRQGATESGKALFRLPNAFRYRKEIVAGALCNGKDQLGLAVGKIEDDPTLARGTCRRQQSAVVAGRGADKRGAS